MTPYNRISIKQVMDDILDHPMLQDLSLERAISYAVEFIKIVGMPAAFDTKEDTIKIREYAGEIPDDCYQIISLKKDGSNSPLTLSTSVYGTSKINTSIPSYVIRGNQIHTSFKEGIIKIVYLALPTDEETGFPTIPDVASYIRALELYIKKKWFTILFDLGKLQAGIYQNVKQEYAFAVGQAQNELIMPSLDEMEAFTNMWNSLLPSMRAHKTGYATLGSGEIKRF